jgi:hypothetical protein
MADGQRADRHTPGHLHDGQQGVQTFEGTAFDRHTEHGNDRLRRRHTGQMRRPASSSDDHLDATCLGPGGELC